MGQSVDQVGIDSSNAYKPAPPQGNVRIDHALPKGVVAAYRVGGEPQPYWVQERIRRDVLRPTYDSLNNYALSLICFTSRGLMYVQAGEILLWDEQGNVYPQYAHGLFHPEPTVKTEPPKPEIRISVRDKFRADVFEDIERERDKQMCRWGHEFDSKNTANDWVSYIARHAMEGAKFEEDVPSFRRQMVKVAAIAVAALEAVERNNGLPPRHYDKR